MQLQPLKPYISRTLILIFFSLKEICGSTSDWKILNLFKNVENSMHRKK